MLVDGKPVISWIFDTKGWAFSKIASELIAHLPSFKHVRIFKDRMKVDTELLSYISDVIVIFHPYDLRLFDCVDNVVARVDSHRGMVKCELA